MPLRQALIRELEKHHLAGDEPMTLLVIENEGKLRAALPTLRPMVAEGIFVLFDAEVIPLP